MESQRVLSWNEFQRANEGRSVNVADWQQHRRDVYSKRPVSQPRPLVTVPARKEPGSEESTESTAREEKRKTAALQWRNLLGGKRPPAPDDDNDNGSGSGANDDRDLGACSDKRSRRGRPSSVPGSEGGCHRKVKRGAGGRPSTKAARSVAERSSTSVAASHPAETRSTASAPRPEPPPKKKRVDWSTETERLELGLDAYKMGLSMHESSRTFGVPYSVLQWRVAGIVGMAAGLGCKPILSEQWEQQLHDHILK